MEAGSFCLTCAAFAKDVSSQMIRLVFAVFFYSLVQTLFAQNELSVADFQLLPNDLTARTIAPQPDADGKLAALIKVVSNANDFDFDGGTLGVVRIEQKKGEWWVYVPSGSRVLTILHPQLKVLRNYAYPVPIVGGNTYEMRLEHGIVERVIREKEIISEWIVVDSEPKGADVYLNEEPVGKTLYQNEHPVGKYTWRVQLMNYKTQTGTFELKSGEAERLVLALVPDYGEVIISSNPEAGMSVALDGYDRGVTTPCTLSFVPSGHHKITLTDEWYETKELEVDVVEGEQTRLVVNMNPTFARLDIAAPEGAEIFVNNEFEGVQSWSGRVRPGAMNVRVVQEGFKEYTKKLVLRVGEHQKMNVELEPRIGRLRVVSEPYGAEILVDGKAYGTSPRTITDLNIGNRTVELFKEGYDPKTFKVEIEEDQTADLNATLEVSQWIEQKVVLRFDSQGIRRIKGDRTLASMESYIHYSDVPMGDYHFLFREKLNSDEREWKADLVSYKTRASGASALKSMVLPGWGTRAVTYGERGTGATVSFLILGGMATGFKLFSNYRYNRFLSTNDVNSSNLYYNEANLANQLFLVSGGVAATIYVFDVLRTFTIGRGVKNRTKPYRRQLQANSITIQ